MGQAQLDRRHVLSGGLAFASACMVAGRAGAVSPMEDAADLLRMELEVLSEREVFGLSAAEWAACHTPFRAAFLSWLGEASERSALPFSVDTAEPSCTDLHVPGLHPALKIRLDGETGINVYANWHGVCWDILASMDVHAAQEPDGSGWRNTLLIPEAQHLHPTQEACWQQDGFESLLRWLNDDLAAATHLALCGRDDCYGGEDWTSAHLVRDGLLVPSGESVANISSLRELLPLHAGITGCDYKRPPLS